MTKKRVFELAVMFVSISMFGVFTYSMGMQHNAGVASLTLDVSGCVLDYDEPPVAELQPL
jgi:hypothetical protein